MNGRHLRRVVFCVGKSSEAEAREQAQGVSTDIPAAVQGPEDVTSDPEGTLYLTDSGEIYSTLQQRGFAVTGWVHGGRAASFPGASFLVEEPAEVEPEDLNRIYERCAHIPWTIAVTKRLIIREVCLDDLDALYGLYDREAEKFLPLPDPDREKEKKILSEYIRRVYGLCGFGYWGAVLKDTGELIGRCGFSLPEKTGTFPSLGYLVRRDHRGCGLALEMCGAALWYAEKFLGFPEVSAQTSPGNIPSRRLLERLGFSLSGEETRPGGEKNLIYRKTFSAPECKM